MENSSIGTPAERRQGPEPDLHPPPVQRSVEDHGVLQGPAADPQASAQPQKKQQPESRRRTMSNSFMMLRYKISMCKRTDPHNWRLCPYAHDGEAGWRRPPHTYQAVMCDFTKSKECPHGETCPFARNALEYWLHPDKYRTTLCGQGEACNRNICFFAHNQQELRTPGSEPITKAGRKKAESDLASQLTSGAGSSSSGQQLLQVQQQLAQLAMGAPHQMVEGSTRGRSSSSAGRGAHLAQASAGGGLEYQQAWLAQQGVAGLGAQQGVPGQSTLAAAAQAAAAVASGRGSLVSPEQYQRVTALQPAMQGALANVPGAVSPMAVAAGMQAGTVPGALAAAGAMYPMYGSVPESHQQQQQQQVISPRTFLLPQQQQQQQVVSPAAGSSSDTLARLAAAPVVQQQALQAQSGLVPGMPPSPGWGMSAYAGAPAGTSAEAPRVPTGLSASQEAAMQAGQMYPVGMVQYQPGAGGVAGQAVWVPQHAQHAYGGAVPVMSSPQAAAYMSAWQSAAPQQQGMAGQQPQQLMTLLQAQQQAGQAVAMLLAGAVFSVLPQGAQGAQGAYAPAEQYMGSAEAALQGAQGVQHYRQPQGTRGL